METVANDKIQVSGPKRCGLMQPKPPGANYQSHPLLGGLVYGLSWNLRTVVYARILLRGDFSEGMPPDGRVDAGRTSRSPIP